jgi:hypothetical protein
MPDKEGSDDEKKSTKSVVNKKQKQMMGEEGYDVARDQGRVRPSKDKKDATTMPVSKEIKKTRKVNKGPSALELVKKKYKGQIMDELDLSKVAEKPSFTLPRFFAIALLTALRLFIRYLSVPSVLPSLLMSLSSCPTGSSFLNSLTTCSYCEPAPVFTFLMLSKRLRVIFFSFGFFSVEYDSQSKEKKNNPAFQSNKLNPKPVYNSYNPLDEMSHSTEKKPKEKKDDS